MAQRWSNLLFVHWKVACSSLAPLLPSWLEPDTYQGSAWIGAVPFWLERIKIHGLPPLPGLRNFPDLNLRTYVRDRFTRTPGVYCFSLDAGSLFAVGIGRALYNLPYHWAEMRLEQRSEREFSFYSRRRFSPHPVIFSARYRGLGPDSRRAMMPAGSFERFLAEHACLFGANRAGHPLRASLHVVPCPLEDAEAEIDRNDLVASLGINLRGIAPVLHYSRRMAVYIWPAELLQPVLATRPVTAVAAPLG
jgi:uncharacterized protein YqjF (DUF2071 family)